LDEHWEKIEKYKIEAQDNQQRAREEKAREK